MERPQRISENVLLTETLISNIYLSTSRQPATGLEYGLQNVSMLLDLEISRIYSTEEIRNAYKIVVDKLQGKETIYETCM
jgi:hypothetical protein